MVFGVVAEQRVAWAGDRGHTRKQQWDPGRRAGVDQGRCESDGEESSHQKRLERARGREERSAKRAEGPPAGDGEVRATQQG